MDPVPYQLPGAVATYSAKSALFTAGYADRGTFFDSTGSFTITIDPTSMSAGWSAWFRTLSGTQTFDPSGTVTINGATTYAVSNAGDVVLVEYDGTNFVISQTQLPGAVKITGGTINGAAIGGASPAAGAFTTLAASGVFTSTDTTDATAIGTASMVLPGGLSVAKAIIGSSTLTLIGSTVIPVVLTNTAASSSSSGPFFSVNEDDGAALASGDRLGGMLFGGSRDAAHTINRSAGFTAFTTEAWSATNCGAKLIFHTVPNGATARTDALTLDQDGSLILTGPLKLANAYVATPQVGTGYVTVKDSGGTTYKVLVAA